MNSSGQEKRRDWHSSRKQRPKTSHATRTIVPVEEAPIFWARGEKRQLPIKRAQALIFFEEPHYCDSAR
jgi:hypothetical protein